MQLIVVGMHRSGTSVLARLLNLMGVYFAPEGMGTGSNPENPKGFWERRDVRALNDFVLHGVGCDWNRVSRFDRSLIPEANLAEFEKRAEKIVLSMDANRPWFIKEPRLCLLLPLWLRVLEVPLCIHIIRSPIEVASSLKARNDIPMPAGLALWEYYNRSARAAMWGVPSIVVRHRDLMHGPVDAVASLHAQLLALGVNRLSMPTAKEIESFVSQKLYREREGGHGLEAFADAPQVRLFEKWLAGKSDRGSEISVQSMEALVSYEESLPPLSPPNSNAQKSPSGAKTIIEVNKKRELWSQNGMEEELQLPIGQHDRQIARLKEELSLSRDRELSSRELASGLQKLAVDHDRWIHDLRAKLEEKIRQSEGLSRALREAERAIAKLKIYESKMKACMAAQQAKDALQIASLTAEVRGLRLSLGEIEKKMSQAEEVSRSKDEELVFLKRVNELLASDLSRAEADAGSLRSSPSWRLAAPIRRVRDWLRGRTGLDHGVGTRTGLLKTSRWFDARWYLAQYPDARQSGVSPEVHYLAIGAAELRDPSPEFDTGAYLRHNPDVLASGENPLVHYILHGEREGRSPKP